MLRVILNGCNGAMGRVLDQVIAQEADVTVVAGVDLKPDDSLSYPVFTSLADCNVEADAVIDFTVAAATDAVLEACREKKIPLVLATTGLSKEQLDHVSEAAKEIPLVQSFNMSLGINTLAKVLEQISPLLAEAGFDIEIVERHHRKKVDAPSGTALLLANAANRALDEKCHYVYDRSSVRQKRDPYEIGISAVRGGTIVGVHDVIFAGEDEVIELNHQAFSKAVFAKGAITAAKFLQQKEPGYYTMRDVIG
ncbi:MAG: 4-hydroxy-tetrahydrodipicolinate reductase [Lachnospiraceae bacterium]|nr:4-hydroxy-tetrahydrodipicolinate reductase [Lachnospiraceae bacterium]